jgi:hypothetical protein
VAASLPAGGDKGTLLERLKESRAWRYLGYRKGFSADMHLPAALNAMFFQTPNFSGARPYIQPQHERLPDFMPALTHLVVWAPQSGYLAGLFLTLAETSPSVALLPSIARAAEAWAIAIGVDPDFWLEKGKK